MSHSISSRAGIPEGLGSESRSSQRLGLGRIMPIWRLFLAEMRDILLQRTVILNRNSVCGGAGDNEDVGQREHVRL